MNMRVEARAKDLFLGHGVAIDSGGGGGGGPFITVNPYSGEVRYEEISRKSRPQDGNT